MRQCLHEDIQLISPKLKEHLKKLGESKILDITGDRYTRLVAISKDPNNKRNWLCLCDCGNTVSVQIANLRGGNSKSCGCIRKEKAFNLMSEKHRIFREDNGFSHDYRLTDSDTLERKNQIPLLKKIRKRDGNCCVMCQTRCKLSVHHIKPFSLNKDLRSNRNNLVSLCPKCHLDVHAGNWWGKTDWFLSGVLQAYTNYIEGDKEECQFDLQLLLK